MGVRSVGRRVAELATPRPRLRIVTVRILVGLLHSVEARMGLEEGPTHR
jgi:hypothetical protein